MFRLMSEANHVWLKFDQSSYSSYNEIMKKVGIKELKNNLSFYINKVRRGETVLVTHRNDVVAKISYPIITKQNSLLDAYLKDQSQIGAISLASSEKIKISTDKSKGKVKKINYRKIYEETRSNRL